MGKTTIFYDGECGLCHGFVTFALKRDPEGSRFQFAPLQGDTFRRLQSGIESDSVVVKTESGELLIRSNAILHVMRQMPRPWPALAALSSLVPRVLRDLVYRFIAGIRRVIFPRPPELCPITPPELRERFLP